MNRFNDAVDDLLSNVPPRPGLDALATRMRRRQRRRAIAIVVLVGVVSLASVGVAASLGRNASSPQIAVSPPTSTTSSVPSSTCGVRELERQEAGLKAQEKQLDDELRAAQRTNAPNSGVLDAERQAVLRRLSDVMYQRLSGCDGTPGTSIDATTNWCAQFDVLDAQRLQLESLERRLNDQLTFELAAHSPNAGATDAQHQAVLRQQSDVQQRILRLEETGPPAECP